MTRPLRYNGGILASSGTEVKGSIAAQAGAVRADAVAGRAPSYHLLGQVPDFLLLGPGFTLLTSGVLGTLAALGHLELATSIAFALTLLFVGPHYAATYRRAYASAEILRAHPVVTLVVPIVLGGAAVAAVKWPRGVGVAFFAVYVIWSGYHYSGQSLGLAMLYPLRQGARLSASEKRLIAFPLYASWIVSLLGLFRLDVAVRNPAYQLTRESLFRAPLPAWALVVAAAGVVASLSSVAVLARRRRRRGTPLPPAVWSVVLAQVAWFLIGLWNPFFNIVLVPIFHGAQYLSITSWHQTRGKNGLLFAAYALTVVALGFAINPGFMVVGRMLAGPGPVVAAAVLTFVNLHHFLMDGRIWRLRERRVAASFTGVTAP